MADEFVMPTNAAQMIATIRGESCSTDAVRRWADSGRLPSIRAGRVRLFKASEVRQFAEALAGEQERRGKR